MALEGIFRSVYVRHIPDGVLDSVLLGDASADAGFSDLILFWDDVPGIAEPGLGVRDDRVPIELLFCAYDIFDDKN